MLDRKLPGSARASAIHQTSANGMFIQLRTYSLNENAAPKAHVAVDWTVFLRSAAQSLGNIHKVLTTGGRTASRTRRYRPGARDGHSTVQSILVVMTQNCLADWDGSIRSAGSVIGCRTGHGRAEAPQGRSTESSGKGRICRCRTTALTDTGMDLIHQPVIRVVFDSTASTLCN